MFRVSQSQEEEAGGDEEDDADGDGGAAGGGKKKKKKKPKKKKKGPVSKQAPPSSIAPPATGKNGETPSQEQVHRLLRGKTDYYVVYGQTNPPTKCVAELFPNGGFPIGEIQPHGKTRYPDPHSSWARQTDEERR